MPKCQAIIGHKSRYQIDTHQQCQQSGTHIADGVVLWGAHFNAGFRKELTIIRELRILNESDLIQHKEP